MSWMRIAMVVVAVAGCGRIGFSSRSGADAASGDATGGDAIAGDAIGGDGAVACTWLVATVAPAARV